MQVMIIKVSVDGGTVLFRTLRGGFTVVDQQQQRKTGVWCRRLQAGVSRLDFPRRGFDSRRCRFRPLGKIVVVTATTVATSPGRVEIAVFPNPDLNVVGCQSLTTDRAVSSAFGGFLSDFGSC